ncbi:MAG: hypothetical protein JWM82_2984 [Myxococcales bacterium]|nr:hypothetical protein [Myxococcales bacterium]
MARIKKIMLAGSIAALAICSAAAGRFIGRRPTSVAANAVESTVDRSASPAALARLKHAIKVYPQLPVVDGLTATHPPSARDELEDELQALHASGAPDAKWFKQADTMSRQWLSAAAEAGLSPNLSRWDCFEKGCTTTISKLPTQKMMAFNDFVSASASFQEWPGGKFKSGPIETASGDPTITWIFFIDHVDKRAN